jgi:hypothetical protein
LQALYIRFKKDSKYNLYGVFAMMGYEAGFQPKLFYHQINLEQRVPHNHLLRKIQAQIDFDFIYAEVQDSYGGNGNVSVPPPVILKMLLLLVLYNVRSERELMDTIPFLLDWLWFLGYEFDSEVPDHSVLSKARSRWGWRHLGAFLSVLCGPALRDGGWVSGRQ